MSSSKAVIRAVDPHDDSAFRAWYDAMSAGAVAERTAPLVTAFEAMSSSLRNPPPTKSRLPFGAFVGDQIVGTLLVDLPLTDNVHLAEVDLNVPPEHRGNGYGTALLAHAEQLAREAGRTTFLTEINVPSDQSVQTCAGSRFALKHGFTSENQEDHLVLDLPAPEAMTENAAPPGDYTLVSWSGRCPDDVVEGYAHLSTMMNRDVPHGGVDHQPVVVDVDRIRSNELRLVERGYVSILTAARHADGTYAAYSLMFVSQHMPDDVWQDDTYVLTAHRGHGLGATMKAVNLKALQEAFPGHRRVHTWTAEVNGPMQRINEAFGFRKVEQMHEFQRIDTATDSPAADTLRS